MRKGKSRAILLAGMTFLLVNLLLLGSVLPGYMDSRESLYSYAPAMEEVQVEPDSGAVEAPDFLAQDRDGNEVRFYGSVGQPMVVSFFVSWHESSRAHAEEFQRVFDACADSDVLFLMVDLTDGEKETVEMAAAFLDEEGYTFPVLFDTQSQARVSYNIPAAPSTVFIRSDGTIAGAVPGALSEAAMLAGIEQLD